MPLVAIGISEREVGVGKFEGFALSEDEISSFLKTLTRSDLVEEAVVLTTCARTEFFAVVNSFHAGIDFISEIFASSCKTTPSEIANYAHVYYDAGAIRHLFRLTSGIESQIIGESEIIGQVRRAFGRSHELGFTGSYLEKLFQRSLEVGKQVRSETAISQGITSSAYAAAELLTKVKPDTQRALVVGAGDIGSKVVTALVDRGLEVHIANRTLNKAELLASQSGSVAVPLESALANLTQYDAAIFATGSSHYLVGRYHISSQSDGSLTDKMVLIDLGMPRNLDPEIASLGMVSLLDLDSVYEFLDAQMDLRRSQIGPAEKIIEEAVAEFSSRAAARESLSPTIASLYQMAEKIKLGELDRFRTRLGDLSESEQQAVEALALGIVAKMLHSPVSKLKATSPERAEKLADALNYLFDL